MVPARPFPPVFYNVSLEFEHKGRIINMVCSIIRIKKHNYFIKLTYPWCYQIKSNNPHWMERGQAPVCELLGQGPQSDPGRVLACASSEHSTGSYASTSYIALRPRVDHVHVFIWFTLSCFEPSGWRPEPPTLRRTAPWGARPPRRMDNHSFPLWTAFLQPKMVHMWHDLPCRD